MNKHPDLIMKYGNAAGFLIGCGYSGIVLHEESR
jgi:hypothetical protein